MRKAKRTMFVGFRLRVSDRKRVLRLVWDVEKADVVALDQPQLRQLKTLIDELRERTRPTSQIFEILSRVALLLERGEPSGETMTAVERTEWEAFLQEMEGRSSGP